MRKRSDKPSTKPKPKLRSPSTSKRDEPKEGNVASDLAAARREQPDEDSVDTKVAFMQILQNAGHVEASLDTGDSITATVGKEIFFPVKFNGFEVGPVSVSTTVRPHEAFEGAYFRAYNAAVIVWNVEYDMKTKQFFQRLAEVKAKAE